MIRHIVLWKIAEHTAGKSREDNILQAEILLRALPALVPSIRSFEVGRNLVLGAEAFDLVLIATFDSLQGLQEYQDHPEHQRVVRFLRSVRSGRAVADVED